MRQVPQCAGSCRATPRWIPTPRWPSAQSSTGEAFGFERTMQFGPGGCSSAPMWYSQSRRLRCSWTAASGTLALSTATSQLPTTRTGLRSCEGTATGTSASTALCEVQVGPLFGCGNTNQLRRPRLGSPSVSNPRRAAGFDCQSAVSQLLGGRTKQVTITGCVDDPDNGVF